MNQVEEFVRGRVHTQGVDNLWSLLKRSLAGTYVAVAPFQIDRYVTKQVFRYNDRATKDDRLANAGRVALLIWSLPACQSLFLTAQGPVVMQGAPLVSGAADVPAFDRQALIQALRIDQAGEGTFHEFLAATWRAGVVRYEVDLAAHGSLRRLQR